MKFSFSTRTCPEWDLDTIVSRGHEFGYRGIEVDAGSSALADLEKVGQALSSGKIHIACVATSVAMSGKKRLDMEQADALRLSIENAQRLGAPVVKMLGTSVRPGRTEAAVQLARWLRPLADFAAERQVGIVVENSASFRTAHEMWSMLDLLNHPAVGAAWDVLDAALVNEEPSLSVPVLNSRIHYVQVRDAQIAPAGAGYAPLGSGDVAIEDFLKRLRGIGYAGYVNFGWDRTRFPNLPGAEAMLPEAIETLRHWTKIVEAPVKKPAHKPAAAAK